MMEYERPSNTPVDEERMLEEKVSCERNNDDDADARLRSMAHPMFSCGDEVTTSLNEVVN